MEIFIYIAKLMLFEGRSDITSVNMGVSPSITMIIISLQCPWPGARAWDEARLDTLKLEFKVRTYSVLLMNQIHSFKKAIASPKASQSVVGKIKQWENFPGMNQPDYKGLL